MIYVVKFHDGTMNVVEKSNFSTVDIDKVEIVYSGNYEVKVVTELVPQGEEQDKLQETVETFHEKYKNEIVTESGPVAFKDWFENAATGDSAVIPENVMVPVKTYKVVRIKKGDSSFLASTVETESNDARETSVKEPEPENAKIVQKEQKTKEKKIESSGTKQPKKAGTAKKKQTKDSQEKSKVKTKKPAQKKTKTAKK